MLVGREGREVREEVFEAGQGREESRGELRVIALVWRRLVPRGQVKWERSRGDEEIGRSRGRSRSTSRTASSTRLRESYEQRVAL